MKGIENDLMLLVRAYPLQQWCAFVVITCQWSDSLLVSTLVVYPLNHYSICYSLSRSYSKVRDSLAD